MIIKKIKTVLTNDLKEAQSIWIASAMISYDGWLTIQNNLPEVTTQYYLIGVDLLTDPKVLDLIVKNREKEINAKVYETQFTFHPKVYLIQKNNGSFTAFVGSSNTTEWGLAKNVEMNFQIDDQDECAKLLKWFNSLYSDGQLITKSFVDDYRKKFVRASKAKKRTEKRTKLIQKALKKGKGQFFSKNQHAIFYEEFHRKDTRDLKQIRLEVREKFIELHGIIYPQFQSYGLTDLYCHHQSTDIVSRHYFNPWSGRYIDAMWLHYGKSLNELSAYKNKDKSINKPYSFINNIRMQVIIQAKSVGIWLVLGRNGGSRIDREHFRNQMKNVNIQNKFFTAFKNLGDEYWIDVQTIVSSKDIKTPGDLLSKISGDKLENYFIIGCNINCLDKRLSKQNISRTVLEEFKKLYPLYEIMRHK